MLTFPAHMWEHMHTNTKYIHQQLKHVTLCTADWSSSANVHAVTMLTCCCNYLASLFSILASAAPPHLCRAESEFQLLA